MPRDRVPRGFVVGLALTRVFALAGVVVGIIDHNVGYASMAAAVVVQTTISMMLVRDG